MVGFDKNVGMALGLAAVGEAVKLYSANSKTLTADKKTQYTNVGNYTLYAGLGLAVIFMLTKD
jgi:hypothetical protein